MKNQNLYKRLIFALQGLKSAWLSERSFRAQIVITFIVIVSLIFLKASLQWWAIIILVIGATLAAELINTSLEYMLDLLHPNYHSQIGRAKDCAAAAVLVLSCSAILIFAAFLYEKFA
ncbi:MAG: diacylglycerol kinase [Bacteriovorax sp.]|nr:diacylglycerol kinase [Bacteriovorax sp.]